MSKDKKFFIIIGLHLLIQLTIVYLVPNWYKILLICINGVLLLYISYKLALSKDKLG
jgi:hypothetical protein